MDEGAWQATVHGVTKSRTRLSDFTHSMVVLVVKKPPANVRDVKDEVSIPGLRRSPGGGNGNPF